MNIFQKYTKRTNSRLTKIFALLMFPIACSLLGCGWGGSIASSGNTATTTTLIASSSTVSYGSSLTLTASILPSTAAGTVTLYDGLTSIGSGTAISGVATLSLTSLAVGSHSITAVYGGSATYTTSTSSAVTVTVTSSSSLTATSTTLVTSATSATVGTSITLTASVVPSAATGTVYFYDGTTSVGSGTLSSGIATETTTGLAVGTHTVTAVYSGSTTYATSTSNAVAIVITAASTTSSSSCGLGTGAYVLSAGSATLASASYSATSEDESAVCVQNYGSSLTLTNPTLSTTGSTSSTDNSSFYGLNAVALAYGSSSSTNSGGTLTITGGTITSSGTGANGVFASGEGATVNITGTTINVSGGNAHGLDAAEAGTLNITNVTATSSGASGSIIATDRGGGFVTVSGGTYATTGMRSAGIYTTGTVTCANAATFTIADAEGIVVEGANSLSSNKCVYTSTANSTDNRTIFIYNSASGDANAGTASLSLNGDTYTATSTTAPFFYVTNTTTAISLTGVTINNSSSALLTAQANSNWGTTGSNGGLVTMTTSKQTLSGAIAVDDISTLALSLTNSSVYTGAINTADTGETVGLTLDATSSWQVGGTSYLTTLSDTGGISGTSITNIYGNGYTVYYLSASNTALGGKTYTLAGTAGGYLKPM